jgi:hypothetical protein
MVVYKFLACFKRVVQHYKDPEYSGANPYLAMVVYYLDYWVFGLCPLSRILINTTFQKWDLFPSSREVMGDTYSVGSAKKS